MIHGNAARRLAPVFDWTPVAVFTVGRDLTVTNWNLEAERMFGWTAEEVIGRPLPILPPNSDGDRERLERCMRGLDYHKKGGVTRVRKDGRLIEVFAATTTMFDPVGKPLGVVGFMVDITQYATALHESFERTRLYRSIADELPIMISYINSEGRYEFVNRAYEVFFGRTRDQLVGRRVREMIEPAAYQSVWPHIEAALQGYPATAEAAVHDALGRDRRLLVSYAPYRSGGSDVKGVYSLLSDVTEQCNARDELYQIKKMESIGQLVGGVAHDFNNMLAAVLGNCELALGSIASGESPEEDVREAYEAAKRAAQLTKQLLAFSRRQILRAEAVDVDVVARETERLLRRLLPTNIKLDVVSDGNNHRVIIDRMQLQQVLLNLAVNARDAMPDGGVVTMHTTVMREAGRTFVQIAVKDTGVGIRSEVLPYIFEPFFTTKLDGMGTGIGLATVLDIISSAAGNVTVESELNRGTTFCVKLPAAEEPGG